MYVLLYFYFNAVAPVHTNLLCTVYWELSGFPVFWAYVLTKYVLSHATSASETNTVEGPLKIHHGKNPYIHAL